MSLTMVAFIFITNLLYKYCALTRRGRAGSVRFQNGKLVAGAKGSCTPKYLRSMLIVGSTEFNFKPTTKKKRIIFGYF